MVLSTVSTVAITNSSNQIYNKGNKQWLLSDCVEFWLRKHSNSVIAICIKTSATTTPQNQCAATEMSRALINLGIWSIKIHQCEILFVFHWIELHYIVRCVHQKISRTILLANAFLHFSLGSGFLFSSFASTWSPWCIRTSKRILLFINIFKTNEYDFCANTVLF